jgi:hypothetical protein
MNPRPLPEEARSLCQNLLAPPRLIAHLRLVHDVAASLIAFLESRFPEVGIDRAAVLFGAATHDLGKVLHPNELTEPGRIHEEDGPPLLERRGVPRALARFARTHGSWEREDDLPLEDLLVALADTAWKGKRTPALEARVVTRIAEHVGVEEWRVFTVLDEHLDEVTSRGDERLAWQSR